MKLIFLVFLFAGHVAYSQNLVLNPSFEDTLQCPTFATYPYFRSINWIQPTGGSSDFFNVNTNCLWGGGVPQNIFGYQFPNTLNSYIGLAVYLGPPNQNNREYIMGTLDDTLISNHKYCVSFYISLSNTSKFHTDDIGAYFCADSNTITDYTMTNVLNLVPQIENISGNFLGDTTNWVLISRDFIAQGGEKFITIGNFKTDMNTSLITNVTALHNHAYYYIDDVSVIDCTVGLEEINNLEIQLYPNPAINELQIITSLKNYSYEIVDLTGRKIINGKVEGDQKTINISKLTSGNYLFKQLSNYSLQTIKFTVIKD